MSTAEKYIPRYTIEDYSRWQGDWELWQGFPVSMSPSPFGRHAKVLLCAGSALKRAIEASGCQATALVELDWIIAADTVVRPDVIVVCGDAPDRHLETRPEIVVEIFSESTRERDLNFKRTMYQEQCVPYYLMIDPVENQLTVLRLDAGQFAEMEFSEVIRLTICGHCNLEIPVTSIFS